MSSSERRRTSQPSPDDHVASSQLVDDDDVDDEAGTDLAAAPDDDPLTAVRERVANDVAFRAIRTGQLVNDVKIGVALVHSDSEQTLRAVLSALKGGLSLTDGYLFAVAPAHPPVARRARSRPVVAVAVAPAIAVPAVVPADVPAAVWPLILIASDPRLLSKASTLASAKFLGRIRTILTNSANTRWVAYIQDAGSSALDEAMLWDVVRKTPHVLNPHTPPLGSRGIDAILAAARTRLLRLTPRQALADLHDLTVPLPVVLVDIRPAAQRAEHGVIPHALVVERNVLEWRFDPRSDARLPVADRYDLRVIIFCHEGYTSSLAAVALHDIGLLNATDIIGGYMAWKDAGLPTTLTIQA